MRKFLSVLLMLVIFASSASAYITAKYSFNVPKKTDVSSLKSEMDIPESEIFNSEEEMTARLELYRQNMINTRLFRNVEYSYVMQGSTAIVTFNIDDAGTFIVLPYPKYDSSNGLEVKIKAQDRNLLGKFASFDASAGIEQQASEGSSLFDFSNSRLTLDFNLSKLPVGKNGASMNASIDGVMNLSDKSKSRLNLSIDFTNVKVGDNGIKLAPSAFIKSKFGTKKGFALGGGVSIHNISLGNGKNMQIAPYASIYTPEDTFSKWKPYMIGYNMSFFLGRFTFIHNLDYNGRNDKYTRDIPSRELSTDDYKWNKTTVNGTLVLNISRRVLPYLEGEYVRKNYEDTRYANTHDKYAYIGEGVRVNLINSGEFSLKGWLGEYNEFNLEDSRLDIFMKGGIEFGGGKLNYTDGDFRHGLSYSLISDANVFLTRGKSYKDSYIRAHGELSWFPLRLQYFNPGVRVIGTVSSQPFFHYLPEELDETKNVDGYGFMYNVRNDNKLLAEYIRGIGNGSEKLKDQTENAKLASVVNLNLTFRADSEGSFMDTYLIPFMDFALIRTQSETPYYLTGGLEMLFIFKSFPGYPIRVSVGMDALGLVRRIRDKSQPDADYEIFFGLHHFF